MRSEETERMSRVGGALAALGHDVEMLVSDRSTHSAAEAAAAAGCQLGQIVKTLVVRVGGKPQLVLVAGDRKLDDRLLAARAGVGRKQVSLASAADVLALTGFPVGGVSPFGMLETLPVLVDRTFSRFETIWLAGGTANAIFSLKLEDVVKLTGGEFADVST